MKSLRKLPLIKKSKHVKKSSSKIWKKLYNTKWSIFSSTIRKSMATLKRFHSTPKMDSSKLNSMMLKKLKSFMMNTISERKSFLDPSTSISVFNLMKTKWKNILLKDWQKRIKEVFLMQQEKLVSANCTLTIKEQQPWENLNQREFLVSLEKNNLLKLNSHNFNKIFKRKMLKSHLTFLRKV